MNKKLLQQLALAKQAGTQAQAKDFFAKTPSPGTEPGADDAAPPAGGMQTSAPGAEPAEPGEKGLEMEADGQDLTPEQLEELLHMLEAQGGGGQG